MRVLHILLLLATFVAPASGQTPAERMPRLVPWVAPAANSPGRLFMGVVNPEPTESGMTFVLDATMTTPQGANYYGIGLKLRTLSLATFRLVWRRAGQADMDVALLGSVDCNGPGNLGHAIMLQMSAREGIRLTGREAPGAGPGLARTSMDAGQPSFMYECLAADISVERGIRVLLPASAISGRSASAVAVGRGESAAAVAVGQGVMSTRGNPR